MGRAKHSIAPVLLLVIVGGYPRQAQGDDIKRGAYESALHATVLIRSSGGIGSGWVVDQARKLVVTCQHVVENDPSVVVLFPIFRDGKLVAEQSAYKDERGFTGKVLDADEPSDLAIIQLRELPKGTTELKLAAGNPAPPDRVHSIGNPGASEAFWVYTSGRVRAVYRKKYAVPNMRLRKMLVTDCEIVETDAPINPGDSGGAMVNDEGQVVGVVASYLIGPTLMNAGIAVSEVKRFLDQTVRLLHPQTAADYNLRGERRMKRGQYRDAIADFSAAIRLDKTSARAFHDRAWCFVKTGDYETAMEDCNQALRLDPLDAKAWEHRGWIYEQVKKDNDRAIADYTKAIESDPQSASAYNYRGVCYSRKKYFVHALKLTSKNFFQNSV